MHRLLRTLGDYIKPGKMGRFLNPNTYPDNTWYRKHLERNFDIAFLGDADIIPKLQIPDGVKAFDWSLSGQNLQWDYHVTRQFFSILKPNGCVVFPLTDKFVDDLCNKVDEKKYYMYLRPYFFSQSQLKMMYVRICKHIPVLAWRPMIFNRLLRRSGGGNFEKAYEKAELLISQICNFLTERDLEPCFILIPDNSDKNFDETCLPLFKGRKCVLKVLTSISDYNWGTIEMIINEKYSNGNYK